MCSDGDPVMGVLVWEGPAQQTEAKRDSWVVWEDGRELWGKQSNSPEAPCVLSPCRVMSPSSSSSDAGIRDVLRGRSGQGG